MHNFCYGYAYRLHYSAFSRSKTETFKKAQTRFSLKTGVTLALQCKQTKTETFEKDGVAAHIRLCILDDRVNNYIMLVIVPIDMYR